MVTVAKKDILSRLQRDILSLQGLTNLPGTRVDLGLGAISKSFPGAAFPLNAVHEFITTAREEAPTVGFIAALLSRLMHNGGLTLWIGARTKIFPPALAAFGIAPERVFFIRLFKEKDILWTIEEALKSEAITAVVGETKDLSFTASRRLQLAVEKSHVTGFILRQNISTTACVTRWKISSSPSGLPAGLPGVGFPRWKVELLRVRNGSPGAWLMEWRSGRLKILSPALARPLEWQRKTG